MHRKGDHSTTCKFNGINLSSVSTAIYTKLPFFSGTFWSASNFLLSYLKLDISGGKFKPSLSIQLNVKITYLSGANDVCCEHCCCCCCCWGCRCCCCCCCCALFCRMLASCISRASPAPIWPIITSAPKWVTALLLKDLTLNKKSIQLVACADSFSFSLSPRLALVLSSTL